MKRILVLALFLFTARTASVEAQGARGALDFSAQVTPTAAKAEPVRVFTFYLLTKSYEQIVKELGERDAPPSREKFIDDLKISPELREWLHKHEVMDLTLPDVDKLFTPDDVLHVPEFLLAYQRSNSGGVTNGIPVPKYHETDKTDNPARYEKQRQEYLSALKHFITTWPETMSGMELELDGINPARQWAEAQNAQRRRVQQMAPAEAQTKYLATKIDTDLDGRAHVDGLPPGTYWISSLGMTAAAGDVRLRWDVPIEISAGRTERIELTNLNAIDNLSPKTR
jgi:hypothetical protein